MTSFESPEELLEQARLQIAWVDDVVDGILALMKPTRIPGHEDYIESREARVQAVTRALATHVPPGLAYLAAAVLMERISQLEHFEDEVPR